ncbi:TonB family protein [Sphingobium sp.]|uniref:energy transducer TonB n=1 Tax=Sphingobium sp. TaxID=1912891 RepID=UPI003BB4D6BA
MRMNMMQTMVGQGDRTITPGQGVIARLLHNRTAQTPEGYGRGGTSPVGIGGAIMVHALVIGVWMLMPKEVIETFTAHPFETYAVPEDRPPPPEKTEVAKDPVTARVASEKPTAFDPVVILPTDPVLGSDDPVRTIDPGPTIITPPIVPPRDPVLTEAAIDPRALPTFQPDYPGAMIRQGMEGTVTVRVTISPEGRVTDIERIAASDESFWLATQRHALRKWRFRAATRDGVAVASYKILTVRFTLTDR